ncbi:hypothetical protein GYMLUDRAFT_354355 [Collybiopsis luxurians FD-317 M1]|nr:hypothetical protein GYMLUDRAFT_354355 [Collybiopsis luxurians FD-317 M1]
MTTLPSFVELMASLGIDAKATEQPERQVVPSSSSSSSSPSQSPKPLTIPAAPIRSKSSPSLRDQASRSRTARYSPYSSTFISARRRGSVSSVSSSSSSDIDGLSERSSSCSPTLRSSSPRMRKRAQSKLVVNVFGSSTDLSANTPISTYVRRKTPGTSPSSPSFPRESDDSREFSKPFLIPTLPAFLPSTVTNSASKSELDHSSSERTSPLPDLKPFADMDLDILSRRSHLRTGIRISTSPRFASTGEKAIHHRMVHVA